LAGDSASASAKSAATALGVAADSAGEELGAVGLLAGDLNDDGKVDLEEAKLAAAKVIAVAGSAASKLGQLGKSALQSELVKGAAAGAVVGGALASVLPVIGTATGAAAGAVLGTYKSVGKK